MVIGKGLVAKVFETYKTDNRFLIFASGVSDSTNTDKNAFDREKRLLIKSMKEHEEKIFIYFSTCSIYDTVLSKTPYVLHKLEMERVISALHKRYHIFRVSNLAGRSPNPHTVLNFFVQHILSGTPFFLWNNASRNIIDADDAFLICNYILQESNSYKRVTNIANTANYDVKVIVREIELFFQKKGNYTFVENFSHPEIDVSAIQSIISMLNIKFDNDYLKKVINKYYAANDI
ncbi:MAG TPA: NAD-dependent epimerase/dehydratase family protein [Niabella sp.]|uniref:NAD-dependent epimerase/dehydratase family protein n=1 Tax=Agriterribacter sp. TaxID=2821509 RepID=UPI002CA03903|nr:NAD-dependent epimerase/dehydratase family protein [Agriterribacter sp.]HRO85738.1 NAD-dependent epimerase/dehydratase family protein [Niabella sp.]HRP54966.1 NAD-dependent epimerase/dehydratase family protein [Agriterribacter sp.]